MSISKNHGTLITNNFPAASIITNGTLRSSGTWRALYRGAARSEGTFLDASI